MVAVLGLTAIPTADMNLGIPNGATANKDTAARESYEAVTRGFGEGFNGPLFVTAEPEDASPLTPELTGSLSNDLQQRDDVVMAVPVGVNDAGDLAVFSVIPTSGPDDQATADLMNQLRDSGNPVAMSNDVMLGVTGFTAIGIDISDKLAEVLPIHLTIIIGLSLIILLVVFSSALVPLIATLGFLLSILASFGATTACSSGDGSARSSASTPAAP